MEEGRIYEIVWDNGCFDCSKSCEENIISNSIYNNSIIHTYNNCYETEACSNNKTNTSPSSSNCDPKFYITWFGTDKNKRQLKTAGLAMTKFKHYSIVSLYSSVKGLFD